MPTVFDFRRAVEQALSTDSPSAADAVIARLTAPDALAAFSEVVHDMLVGPISANVAAAREELEESMSSRDSASLIAAAIAQQLRTNVLTLPAPQVLAAQVQSLSYKDWTFELVQRAGRPAVRVMAVVDNAYRQSAKFTTSRTVTVSSTVAQAALQAVLSIEEHEARERLLAKGERVLSPHDPVGLPQRA